MGIPISKKSMPAPKKKEQREVGNGRPKIPTILMKKIPMRKKILIKRKKKPERKANGNGNPKIRIPMISKQILMKNPMRKRKVRKIVMKITATLILVPKRKWPRAKRVKKAREEKRKRRVLVLSRAISQTTGDARKRNGNASRKTK